ncbi:MAG: phospholipid carrier-dependent glycosyltransferase [Eubacteriales bacterium]|nr:phospholipid carrier-dependent glycosyltransferase [Eubacteriales bacterium]
MNPFGWRIMGTLLGALMIPFMYAFGMKLFKKRFYAICSAYLLSVDFMHFVQTRIATIDVYCVFFIILMYYFLYDYHIKKSYTLGYRKSLVPLFLSGLAFGLGAASKWIGIYAGAGLALIFIITKFLESRDYIRELRNEEGYAPAWLKRFVPFHINRTFLWSILFFAIVPAAIYILSYIPYLVLRNYDLRSILDNQIYMYKYHSKDVLDATHAYGSMWWSWPVMLRPMWFYGGGDLPEGIASSIVCMGNPAVWWVGIPAMIASMVISIVKKDRSMLPVFIAAAFQYLPWIFISRVVFIYHFFSTVPFVILSIVYIIKTILEKYPRKKYYIYAYLGLAGVLFAMFYPVLSAMEVSRPYVDYVLRWFPGWDF